MRPAVIYVDPTLKAAWVSAAQYRGMKLVDYISMMMDRPVKVFKIPEALSAQYQGTGYALAASKGGHLMQIAYVRDYATGKLADHIEQGGPHAQFFFRQWINLPECGKLVRELQAKGEVHAGICSNWEFFEL